MGGRESSRAYSEWEHTVGADLVRTYLEPAGDLKGKRVLDIGCGLGGKTVAYGEGGALTASKILVDWAKKAPDSLTIRGGFLEGRLLDVDAVKKLATIPDRETLYSLLASAVAAPVTQVATLVSELLAGVPRAVGAVEEQKREE